MFNLNPFKKIEFHTEKELVGAIPHPAPASKFVPEWYKKMPQVSTRSNPNKFPFISYLMPHEQRAELHGKRTMKACIPVRDCITAGYIIPMWFDISISYSEKDGAVSSHSMMGDREFMGSHPAFQVENSPLQSKAIGQAVYKLINPWTIKLPKGYSALIVPPMYQENSVIEILPAVVDCDTYYNAINLPFIMHIKQGQRFVEQGTPIAQVIPFKRDNWSSVVAAEDELQKSTVANIIRSSSEKYLKLFHRKKRYT